MKKSIKKIIGKLYKNNIQEDVFIKKYEKEKDRTVDEEYIKSLIQRGINNKDANDIEEAIVLIYSGNFDNHVYVKELCNILLESWHFKHEDIVRILHELQDISTIDCLYKVAGSKFEYLDYDDTYQLARKSIKALSAIASEEAINKISLLSNSSNAIIAGYAKKELQNNQLNQ